MGLRAYQIVFMISHYHDIQRFYYMLFYNSSSNLLFMIKSTRQHTYGTDNDHFVKQLIVRLVLWLVQVHTRRIMIGFMINNMTGFRSKVETAGFII